MSKLACAAKEVIDAYDTVQTIINSDASWLVKYSLIFSRYVNVLIIEYLEQMNIDLRYDYDPNASYEQDVMAYYEALTPIVEDLEKIFGDEF